MSPEEQHADLETKIPHSYEPISREFDKTPLEDAVDQYHTDDNGNIIVPKDPSLVYADGSRPESNYQPKTTVEDSTEKSSGNWWTRKKAAAIIAGAALLGVGGAVGAGIYAANQPSHSSTPNGDEGKGNTGEVNKTDTVPAEAKDFIKAFGDRYTDPVSTYYAEKAYVAENGGQDATISNDYIDSYQISNAIDGEKSPLGFTWIQVPLDMVINTPDNNPSIEIFNNKTTQDCLNDYLNLVAKNPSPNAIAVIDNQFNNYCGRDNAGSQKLLDTLKGVVTKYGSAANYKMALGSSDDSKSDATTFTGEGAVIDNVDSDGKIQAFHAYTSLKINVDTYDKAKKTTHQETIPDIQFLMTRLAPTGPVDPGIITIGQL